MYTIADLVKILREGEHAKDLSPHKDISHEDIVNNLYNIYCNGKNTELLDDECAGQALFLLLSFMMVMG